MRGWYSVLFLLILFSFKGFAEDTGSDLQVFDLGKIEVVGEAEAPETTAITIVTSEEFDRSLDESVVDVVEKMPGVVVSSGDKNEPQLMVRGINQKRILILYDGVPMSAPYYGDLDTSELSLDNLSEMSLVRGNASVLYGPNALGGVLSLVSAKPGEKPNFRLFATVDPEGNFSGRGSHGMRLSAFYYQVSAGIRESNGWPMSGDFDPVYDEDGNLLEDGDIRDNAHYSQWSGGAKLGGEWERGEISLALNYADAEKGIPPTTDPDANARFWSFPEWEKASAVVAGRIRLTPDIDFRGNLFYHKYDNVLESYRDRDHSSIKWVSTYDDYSTGLQGRLGWTLTDEFTLKASLNGVIDNHRARGDTDDPWEEYETGTYSAASEATYTATDSLTFQLGCGWETFEFEPIENVEGSAGSLTARTKDIEAFTFSLLGAYAVTDNHEFTAAVSLKNQFPTMHEMFANIEEYEPEDMTTLDAEKAMEYAVGWSYQIPDFGGGLSVFYYDVDDLIDRPNRDALYMNIDKAEFIGAELWARYGNALGFNTGFTYTGLDASNKSPNMPARDIPYVPDHLLQVDAGYTFAFGTGVRVNYMYRSDVAEYDDYGSTFTVPSYSVWDIVLEQELDGGFRLTLQCTNLTDENYVQELGFPQPGRNFKLGVYYKL